MVLSFTLTCFVWRVLVYGLSVQQFLRPFKLATKISPGWSQDYPIPNRNNSFPWDRQHIVLKTRERPFTAFQRTCVLNEFQNGGVKWIDLWQFTGHTISFFLKFSYLIVLCWSCWIYLMIQNLGVFSQCSCNFFVKNWSTLGVVSLTCHKQPKSQSGYKIVTANQNKRPHKPDN